MMSETDGHKSADKISEQNLCLDSDKQSNENGNKTCDSTIKSTTEIVWNYPFVMAGY